MRTGMASRLSHHCYVSFRAPGNRSRSQLCTRAEVTSTWLQYRASSRAASVFIVGATVGAGETAAPHRVRQTTYDVVTLSNLCVDVVHSLPQLPPTDSVSRQQLLLQLEATDFDRSQWEVGGNSNVLIAAARLGLNAAAIGNVGADSYGTFLRSVFQEEGVQSVQPLQMTPKEGSAFRTLVCYVLVTPDSQHAFCSRYDFGPWPLLPGIGGLSPEVQQLLSDTKSLFINGFAFDELPSGTVVAAAEHARRAGAAVFFDPGPRCWTMLEGARRAALDAVLDLSDVVLMTEEEAVALTRESDPEAAAETVLRRPAQATQWCIVKRGHRGSVLCTRTGSPRALKQQAIQVPVKDTVGCGDSFAAAIILGFTQGESSHATMALANAVGAATAMSAGAGRNVASTQMVVRLLEEQLCLEGLDQGALLRGSTGCKWRMALQMVSPTMLSLHKPRDMTAYAAQAL